MSMLNGTIAPSSGLLGLFFLGLPPALINRPGRMPEQIRPPRVNPIDLFWRPAETVSPPEIVKRFQPFLREPFD
jgi:hypothetical protein